MTAPLARAGLDAANYLDAAEQAFTSIERLYAEARSRVRAEVSTGGKISASALEASQHVAHGVAWLATYVEALREMIAYGRRMQAEGRYGEIEDLLTRIGFGEYLAQAFGGIPMNQGEFIR